MYAVACFDGPIIRGRVEFFQHSPKSFTQIHIDLEGFPHADTLYAIHIHEWGDIGSDCQACGSHYNPHDKNHGSIFLHKKERHVGDIMNNIRSNKNKKVKLLHFMDDLVKLSGTYSVIGRSIVIHEKEDDLGLKNTIESKSTGSAAGRIACAVIGHTNTPLLFPKNLIS